MSVISVSLNTNVVSQLNKFNQQKLEYLFEKLNVSNLLTHKIVAINLNAGCPTIKLIKGHETDCN